LSNELTFELIDFLTSPLAQSALERLALIDLREQALLSVLSELRKQFSPGQASALLTQARLRQKALEKFPLAAQMLFVDESLQQASSQAVAAYHAERFSPFAHLADLGSGIGGDAIALARSAASMWAVENNPLLCRLLQHNLAVNGCSGRASVLNADWTQLDLTGRDALFIDPARRRQGRRVFGLAEMEPPLEQILNLHTRHANIAVKVAPGVAYAEIPPGVEVEFISEHGLLKEALLLFGGLRSGFARSATLLPGRQHMHHTGREPEIPLGPPAFCIYEPDPAIIRATLVKSLAEQINACQLDANIAYMTSASYTPTPFARAWQVLHHGPFHLKTLNHWLREANAGEVIVKKRGSAIDPDDFRKKLKTSAKGNQVTVFITRHLDRPWMITAAPLGPAIPGPAAEQYEE